MSTDTFHLWEAEHDYYCENGNFFKPGCHTEYRTWGSFIENDGSDDMDYNLLVRWDWHKSDEGVMGTLEMHWVGQRKAILRSTSVLVHPDEEPVVRAFLQTRFEHLVRLWAPLTIAATAAAAGGGAS